METQKKSADVSKAQISSMESRLSGTLRPVTPRREFVGGLGRRILGDSRGVGLENNVANWHILVLLIAGLASLAMLLAMLARALLALSVKKRTA
jgi:hypothetical protein